MRHLTLGEVVDLHRRLLAASGGAAGIRDIGLLESALAQPAATFAGTDLHPTLVDKAAALGFSLVANHPFVDGNKRTGFTIAILFLERNGLAFSASEADATIQTLGLAAGDIHEAEYADWLKKNSRKPRKR